ncbi:MAG: caspase family protein [Amylibacter sp.]
MRLSPIAFFQFASAFVALAGAVSAKTSALVVGNNDYAHLPKLSVAVSDAQSHCDHLKDVRKIDNVACHLNVTKAEMDRAVLGFLSQLEAGDTAMVVFSGHGVQLNPADPSTVFLLPTDLSSAIEGMQVTKGLYEQYFR